MGGLVLGGPEDRFVWMPVTVPVKTDGGKTERIRFEAKLRDPGQERVSEIFEAQPNDFELLSEMLAGWRNVKGIKMPDGSEISYDNEEQREGFLGYTGVAAAIARAWIDMVQTPGLGRRKN